MNMPILPQFGSSEQSMTSLEIAELCQKRHDNVKRTIENLVNSGVIQSPQIEDIKNHQNRDMQVHVFKGEQGKRDSIVVVAQLCPEFTARLVDRWQELEAQIAQPVMDLNNPEFLRQALLGYTEKVIELEHKVQALEPKAKGLDRIADCTNVLGIREAAKVLKIGQNQLAQYLIDHKVVYRDNFSKIQAYQKSIDQKLVHVVTSAPRLTESGEKVFTQVKLTQKLITRIAKWLEQGVAA